MGCVHSVEKEEAVRRCRERRRLMKHLLSRRAELAAAHMAYLQSLRNTGATLRQFTEVDSMIPAGAASILPPSPPPPHLPPSPPPPPPPHLPPSPPPPPPVFCPQPRKAEVEAKEEVVREDSIDIDDEDSECCTPPPPHLPPSPPPPPVFSPQPRKAEAEAEAKAKEEVVREDSIEIDDDDSECCTPPPPPLHSSTWDFWDPFGSMPSSSASSPHPKKNAGSVHGASVEEENWAETNTEFGEEEEAEGEGEANVVLNLAKEKPPVKEVVDDNSSAVSWFTKDTDMAVVMWRSKKTLAGIVKELDDYFLKAAAGGKEVAVLLKSNKNSSLNWNFEEIKAKSSKSAKVFNALSWSWSSKSLQSCRDACFQVANDACRPTDHCSTLEKLYAEEQRLYKEVKDEEIAKFQFDKKSLLLLKLEGKGHELNTEKMRSEIKELQSRIVSLQESITETCLSISKLRDEELCPQLVELSFGAMQMWRTMYECHQVQNHIAQQVNLLDTHPGTEPTTDSHRLATAQLETEATSWYSSFCNLLRCQREYVNILDQWIKLTDCLPVTNGINDLCEEWRRALERLPDKVAAEAIKSFVSVIHSIALQQTEECSLQKRYDRLENRLGKEQNSLAEFEKHDESIPQDSVQAPGPNGQKFAAKRAKLDSLRKRVEEEKAKYLNSVCVTRAMTLNHLKTSLPNVFQALMGFASVCVQAYEGIHKADEGASSHPEGDISV